MSRMSAAANWNMRCIMSEMQQRCAAASTAEADGTCKELKRAVRNQRDLLHEVYSCLAARHTPRVLMTCMWCTYEVQ